MLETGAIFLNHIHMNLNNQRVVCLRARAPPSTAGTVAPRGRGARPPPGRPPRKAHYRPRIGVATRHSVWWLLQTRRLRQQGDRGSVEPSAWYASK